MRVRPSPVAFAPLLGFDSVFDSLALGSVSAWAAGLEAFFVAALRPLPLVAGAAFAAPRGRVGLAFAPPAGRRRLPDGLLLASPASVRARGPDVPFRPRGLASACGVGGGFGSPSHLGYSPSPRALGPLVHRELPQHLPAQSILRKHPADGLLDCQGRPFSQQPLVADPTKSARIAGVPVVDLLELLAAGDPDAPRVHHDDVITGVGMRSVDGLVLSAQEAGHVGREAAQHDAVGIDDVPATFDIARSW